MSFTTSWLEQHACPLWGREPLQRAGYRCMVKGRQLSVASFGRSLRLAEAPPPSLPLGGTGPSESPMLRRESQTSTEGRRRHKGLHASAVLLGCRRQGSFSGVERKPFRAEGRGERPSSRAPCVNIDCYIRQWLRKRLFRKGRVFQ